jgi:hypothetical protein
MSKMELLEEMSNFFIEKAVAAHGTGVEYDAAVGNEALARTADPRLIPAWTPLPDRDSIEELARRRPQAVRLMSKNLNNSYPLTAWVVGELLEYLQSHQVVTLVAREDITEQSFTYPKGFLVQEVFGRLRGAFPNCLEDFARAIIEDAIPKVTGFDGRQVTAGWTLFIDRSTAMEKQFAWLSRMKTS